jgi:hypothetical protein
MNILCEPAVREHLGTLLAERSRDLQEQAMLRIGLSDLRLEELLEIDSSARAWDQITRVLEVGYLTLVPVEWRPDDRRSEARPTIRADQIPIFVRRMVFQWGAVLVLDDPSPVRQLLLEARAPFLAPWLPPSWDWGEQPVISLAFLGRLPSTLSLVLTHCDTKKGCKAKSPRCACSLVEVVTEDGDDAWACLCDRHNSV